MSSFPPNIGSTQFPYVVEGQQQAEITVNAMFNLLDVLVQGNAISATTTAQPASPANGDRYVLPASPTGANWSGQAGKVAMYYNGWIFLTPREGWKFWVRDTDKTIVYNGASWVDDLPSALTGASYVVVSANSTLTSERVLIAGTGLSLADGGANGNLTLSLSTPVSIANGGTGQTSAQNARNALLPPQSGQSGKVLQTDGTNVSWATASGGTPGGSNTQVQINNGIGGFSGSETYWDNTNKRLGVNISAPLYGAIHARSQASSGDEAIHLDQTAANQTDDPFINFSGESSTNTDKNISTWGFWQLDGYVKVVINGADKWMPFYSPTSSP